MEHAVCLQSVIPLRAEPSDRSEMMSQLLFGELLDIKDVSNGWLQVSLEHDGYTGWVDEKQIHSLDKGSFLSIRALELSLVTDPVAILEEGPGQRIFVVAGSALPGLLGNQLSLAGKAFQFKGNSAKWQPCRTGSSLIQFAMMYQGAPFMWGGRTPLGIDGSGFTQIVYRLAGISLYRTAHQQALQGQIRSFAEEAQPGDLAFFDDEDGTIIHAGIVVGDGKIIHAYGQVRIDTLDHQGIFNHDTGTYTHSLRLIRYHI
ncbi:MAG TPA: C40 family peptidase [Bacteroidales bacterium]|nr:C40 family peptidase [Bacteroidales bacterium]